ncbi:hypothetical protein I4U23_031373 [Adineta vaga]|nr:hypothetical protein I4U23_031373 [Adineta vaga]
MINKITIIILVLVITCYGMSVGDDDSDEANSIERRDDNDFISILQERFERRGKCNVIDAKCGFLRKKCCSKLCLRGRCTSCGNKDNCKSCSYEHGYSTGGRVAPISYYVCKN